LLLLVSWVSVNAIFQAPNGSWLLLSLLLVIWGVDSGAYFTGRLIGKFSFQPHVSPNKTVEGFVGGMCSGVIVALGISWLYPYYDIQIPLMMDLKKWLPCVFVLSLASVLGDLFESLVKRTYGVKD